MFFTIQEVADLLGVHHQSIRRWIRDGKLSAHRVGGIWRITQAQIDAMLSASV